MSLTAHQVARQARRTARIAARPTPGQQTMIPQVSQPLTTPAVPPLNSAPLANAAPAAPQAASADNTNTLFPTERIFEPQNYQGSPLYQFQVKAGEDQLDKSLAARGLSNSGKGIRDEFNIPMQAAAQDTQRIQQVATDNANRLQQIQSDEAGRLERAGNNEWDRSFSLAQLMAAQSPWQGALAGLNNSADLTNQAGQSQANFLKNYYNKVSGGGGGGQLPAQLPSGPNYGNINPAQIQQNQASNNGWQSLLQNALQSLF